jgi:hypothetical protein
LKTYEKVKSKSYHQKELARYDDEDIYPFLTDYTGWDIGPGEYFIECDVQESGKVWCSGLWRVRQDNWSYPVDKGKRIILPDLIDGGAFGLSFPKNEQKELEKRLHRYFKTYGKKEDEHGHFLDISLAAVESVPDLRGRTTASPR